MLLKKLPAGWANAFLFLQFFAVLFTTQMNFRDSTVMLAGTVDFQVILRLAVIMLVFGLCLPKYKIFFGLLSRLPLMLHFTFMIYLFVISMLPQNISNYAVYSLIMHFVALYVIVVLVSECGAQKAFYYYFLSVSVFSLCSLIFYYAVPVVGRYSFINSANEIYMSTRMSGIAGHPNTLGFMTATGLVTFVHLFLQGYRMPKVFYFGAVLILACLVLTDNRTSLGGAILVSFIYFIIYARYSTMFLMIGAAVGLVCVLILTMMPGISSEILGMMSRSGDVSEITSFTGRSNIWEYIVVLIEQKPVFGWGHAQMGSVLSANRDEVGFFVAQAHNIYLQILFSGGFVGLFLFCAVYIGALYIAVLKVKMSKRSAIELCLILQFIMSGVTESIMIASVANNAYLIFIICLSSLSLFCLENRKSS